MPSVIGRVSQKRSKTLCSDSHETAVEAPNRFSNRFETVEFRGPRWTFDASLFGEGGVDSPVRDEVLPQSIGIDVFDPRGSHGPYASAGAHVVGEVVRGVLDFTTQCCHADFVHRDLYVSAVEVVH